MNLENKTLNSYIFEFIHRNAINHHIPQKYINKSISQLQFIFHDHLHIEIEKFPIWELEQ